jgi:hypothetical protein
MSGTPQVLALISDQGIHEAPIEVAPERHVTVSAGSLINAEGETLKDAKGQEVWVKTPSTLYLRRARGSRQRSR